MNDAPPMTPGTSGFMTFSRVAHLCSSLSSGGPFDISSATRSRAVAYVFQTCWFCIRQAFSILIDRLLESASPCASDQMVVSTKLWYRIRE